MTTDHPKVVGAQSITGNGNGLHTEFSSRTPNIQIARIDNRADSAAVRERADHFAALSPGWFWELDNNLRYCYLSDGFTQITGIPESLVLGMAVDETGAVDDDSQVWQEHLAELRNRRSFRDFIYSQVHPDGRTVVVSVNGDACFDQSGTFLGYRGTSTELPNRTRPDAAIQRTRMLCRKVGDFTNVGFWEWDEVANCSVHCSEDLAAIHGLSVADYTRRSEDSPKHQCIHPDDRARYLMAEHEFRTEHAGFEIEYRILCENGKVADIYEVATPIFDSDGRLIRSFGFVKDVTASKHADTAMRKVTDLYAQTESLAKIGHWEWDEVADRTSYCSDELARLHGVSVEDYLKSTLSTADDLNWVHAADRERYKKIQEQYLKGPAKFDIEYRIVMKNGKIRRVREVSAPVFDPDGALVKSVGYIQDISDAKMCEDRLARARNELEQRVQDRTAELREANVELAKSGQRLREATRIARLGHFKWSDNLDKAVFYDDEMINILGASRAECEGESLEQYLARVHPDDRETVRTIYQDCYVASASLDLKYRIVRPDGEIRCVHEVLHAVAGNNDCLYPGFGTLQDITEQEIINATLADTEARLRELGENSREIIWSLSADGKSIDYINPAYEKVLGRTCQSLLSEPMSWVESLHPDDRELVINELRDKINNKDTGPYFSEYRIIRPDGSVRWLQSRAYAIRGDNGEIARFSGFSEDITERKLAQETVQKSHRMDAVGQLTGGIAHDFNNLLAVIMGNSELLEGRLAPEDDLLVQEIIGAGCRGAELTTRLLAFARQQPLRPVVTDINELVSNMVELLRRTLGTAVSVDTVLEASSCKAMVDPGLLENAILNLSLNARDAMIKGGRLEILTTNESSHEPVLPMYSPRTAGEFVSVIVRDDGVGMAPDVLSHALEPFFTTREPGHSSGLGLPMVYGFAKQSRGDLFIDSEAGKGTTVTLCLPRIAVSGH